MSNPVLSPEHERALSTLRAAGCVFAEDELAVLISASDDAHALDAMVARRAAGEPLEQVVGFADFCGVRVRLRPGVFVPRPRSELLIEIAAEACTPGSLVLDLCCGSGALGLAVARRVPGIELHAAEIDPVAVECARDNLATHGARVYAGDLFAAVPEALRGRIAVLIANVPYVPTRGIALLPPEARVHEPRTALDGGPDGLEVFRRVAAEAPAWLAPGGTLYSEMASDQVATAAEVLAHAGLRAESVTDEDDWATVLIGHAT